MNACSKDIAVLLALVERAEGQRSRGSEDELNWPSDLKKQCKLIRKQMPGIERRRINFQNPARKDTTAD
jgi:hypothetical protein